MFAYFLFLNQLVSLLGAPVDEEKFPLSRTKNTDLYAALLLKRNLH